MLPGGLRKSLSAGSSAWGEDRIEEEEPEELPDRASCWFCCAISEKNNFRKAWSVITAILLGYTGTLFPFRLAFLEFKIPMEASVNQTWLGFEWVVDILFCGDLVLNFFFTYRDKENHEVRSLARITCKYMRGPFVLNLMSCIPQALLGQIVTAFSDDGEEGNVTINKSFRLLRLHRFSRLARLVSLVRLVKVASILFDSNMWRWFVSLRGVRVINFVFGLFWIAHLIACGWYLCAALHEDPMETWVGRRVINSNGESLYDAGAMEQWVQALYFVLTVFTTVGFGDMTAVTTGEVLYICFAMVIGVVVNTIIMGKMINAVTLVDQLAIDLGKQKDMMAGFAQHTQLSTAKTEELIALVTDTRSVRQGFDRDEVRKLLTDGTLPRAVVGRLPHDLFGGRLLKNKFIVTDRCLRQHLPPRLPLLLALAMNNRYVSSKEVVYYCYDHPESVFLVLEGAFANVAQPDKLGGCSELPPCVGRLFRVSEQFGPSKGTRHLLFPYQLFCGGSYFGEAELLLQPRPRRSCVRCESDAGGLLLSLGKQDLFSLAGEFHRFASMWRSEAHRREENRRRLLKRLTVGRSYRHLAAFTIQRYLRAFRHRHPSKRTLFSPFKRASTIKMENCRDICRSPDSMKALSDVQEDSPATRADVDLLRCQVLELKCTLEEVVQRSVAQVLQRADAPRRDGREGVESTGGSGEGDCWGSTRRSLA